MQVSFQSRDGTLKRPVFSQQLTQLRRSMRQSTITMRKSQQSNLKDKIHLTFKGMHFPNLTINQKLFNTSLGAVYSNIKSDTLNDLEQLSVNNEKRREELEIIFEMQRAGLNSMQQDRRQEKKNTPVDQLVELTGMGREKADGYLREARGNVEKAYNTYNYRQMMVEEFKRDKNIAKQQAENLLEAANYDKIFAATLYRQTHG